MSTSPPTTPTTPLCPRCGRYPASVTHACITVQHPSTALPPRTAMITTVPLTPINTNPATDQLDRLNTPDNPNPQIDITDPTYHTDPNPDF